MVPQPEPEAVRRGRVPPGHPPLWQTETMTTINNAWFDDAFAGNPVMAILRGFGPERTVELAELAWSLGIGLVEVPIQSETDVEALRQCVAAGAAKGHFVGAGTVLNARDVELARDAGAVFTVSPGFDPEVVRASFEAGLAPLPGVGSASEVQLAQTLGLTWLKAFPASVLTPAWFSAMRGPFPGARFVATGGIDARNAAEYLGAGAKVVGVGSALEDEAQLPLLARLSER